MAFTVLGKFPGSHSEGRRKAVTSSLIVALLIMALAYWVWFGLTQRTINDDDGISILAAQGILEHGYPLLPSGFIYNRGYVPNYLLAGSIAIFGINEFSIMVPSLLLALGSLWLVYLFGKQIMGRTWLGIAAVVFLLALQVQVIYATGPRMYMALQFFTLLAAYSAWRGFVQGEAKHQIITFLAISAAMLSHKEGGALLLAIPLSVSIILVITKQRPSLFSLHNLGGLLLVSIVGFFLFVFDLPGSLRLIAFHGGQSPNVVGLRLDTDVWLAHAMVLERVFPFALLFLPLALFAAIESLANRRLGNHHGLIYLFIIIASCAFIMVNMVNIAQHRFWFFLLPFYALLVCSTLAVLSDSFHITDRRWYEIKDTKRFIFLAVLAGGIGSNLAFIFLAFGPNTYWELAKGGYGAPCQATSSVWCLSDIKKDYADLKRQVEPTDLVISSNPWVANFYLGRVDGLIREKTEGRGKFSEFDHPTDEYFGIPLIDQLDELVGFLKDDRRVWIVVDPKLNVYSSSDTRLFLDRMYESYDQGETIATYVNCMEPPCRFDSASPKLTWLQDYQSARNLNPTDAVGFNNRGLRYESLQVDQYALDDFDKAIQLDPQFAQAYNNRGANYNDRGLFPEAIADFDEAVRIFPDDPESLSNRGMSLYNIGSFQEAIDDFSEAIRLDPDESRYYTLRATVYKRLGEVSAAQDDADRAVELGADPTVLKSKIETLG